MDKHTPDRRSLVNFRRWTRKTWAVFSSLKRNIRIGVLSLSCSILVLPGYSQQQPDSLRNAAADLEYVLDELVVSAERTPVVQSQLMRNVQVITRAELEQASATDLPGLLEHVAGVDIRQRGAFGMQADISTRGGNSDQTLILLNGVNLNDPQTGHHNFDIPVDLSSVQRIEVLQGPGARLYGPNAFTGVINIITGERAPGAVSLSAAAGDFGLASASASSSLNTGKVFHFVSLSGIRSDGFTRNTDFRNGNLYYRTNIPLRRTSVDLQAGGTARAFGANSFYTPKYPDQFEETSTGFVSLKLIPSQKLYPALLIYWRRHNDHFALFRDNAPEWYTSDNYHCTDVAGASLTHTGISRFGKTSVGLDYRYEHILSNVLGNLLEKSRPVPGAANVYFTRAYQRRSLSLMTEHAAYFRKFSFSAGFLTCLSKSLPKGISFYPGLDIGWQVRPQLRWYASANRTLRLPTFTDLFYNGPTNTGNPALQPEQAISVESGFKAAVRRASASVYVFRRWGRNMIDWVKFPGDEKWQSLNLTRVDMLGFETDVNFRFTKNNANAILEQFGLSYTWMQSDKNSNGFISLYVLDNLRHKLDLSLQNRITRHSGTVFKVSYQVRAGGYQAFTDGEFTGEIPYKPVFLLDAKAFYNFGMLKIYVDVSNLLNSEVMDHANVPLPGRWITAGLHVEIPLKTSPDPGAGN